MAEAHLGHAWTRAPRVWYRSMVVRGLSVMTMVQWYDATHHVLDVGTLCDAHVAYRLKILWAGSATYAGSILSTWLEMFEGWLTRASQAHREEVEASKQEIEPKAKQDVDVEERGFEQFARPQQPLVRDHGGSQSKEEGQERGVERGLASGRGARSEHAELAPQAAPKTEAEPSFERAVKELSDLMQASMAWVVGCAWVDLVTATFPSLHATPSTLVVAVNMLVAFGVLALAVIWFALSGTSYATLDITDDRESVEKYFLTSSLSFFVGWVWLVVARDVCAPAPFLLSPLSSRSLLSSLSSLTHSLTHEVC